MNTYKYIYDEVHKELDFFSNCSIHEAASKLFVSVATMHRAVKSFGYESYQDFKKAMTAENKSFENFIKAKNSSDKIEKIVNSYRLGIDTTYEWINSNRLLLEKLFTKMKAAEKIYTFGIGASQLPCKNLYKKSTLVSGNISYVEDFYSFIKILCNNKKGFFILFSRSGITKEILFLINSMSSKKIDFLLVTDNENHPLKDKIPYLVHTESVKRASRPTETSSKITQLLISDIIAESILPTTSKAQFDKFNKYVNDWWKFQNENDIMEEE